MQVPFPGFHLHGAFQESKTPKPRVLNTAHPVGSPASLPPGRARTATANAPPWRRGFSCPGVLTCCTCTLPCKWWCPFILVEKALFQMGKMHPLRSPVVFGRLIQCGKSAPAMVLKRGWLGSPAVCCMSALELPFSWFAKGSFPTSILNAAPQSTTADTMSMTCQVGFWKNLVRGSMSQSGHKRIGVTS